VSRDRPSRSMSGDRCSHATLTTRFLADKYKIDMSSATNVNNFNNAIKRGSDKGDLNLPKGISGRVKLPAKVSKQSRLSKPPLTCRSPPPQLPARRTLPQPRLPQPKHQQPKLRPRRPLPLPRLPPPRSPPPKPQPQPRRQPPPPLRSQQPKPPLLPRRRLPLSLPPKLLLSQRPKPPLSPPRRRPPPRLPRPRRPLRPVSLPILHCPLPADSQTRPPPRRRHPPRPRRRRRSPLRSKSARVSRSWALIDLSFLYQHHHFPFIFTQRVNPFSPFVFYLLRF